ncbi:putative DnaJ domain containing protein [Leishmania shawi]|uniref:DnaJ domain containing protein n=1 Tax=Leishmania shawi TaxID=5680 RepID=A0AAW3C4I2_9TRYP
MPSSWKSMDAEAPGVASGLRGDAEPSQRSARSDTLYAVLNVSHTATVEEITAAYRKLALVYHPDRPSGVQVKFQEIQRAYEVLSATETRTKYDALLSGKVAVRNFKRPPQLESVLQPVYALLADGAFYEFEAAPSKLKCSFHYGDGIRFNGECGSLIGLAGDDFLYWTISGRGYASRLFKAGSSFALSSVCVLYRSNLGLRKVPLRRSSLKSPSTSLPTHSSGGMQGASGNAGVSGGSASTKNAASGSAANRSEAHRIKEALLKRERSRNFKKRLEMIGQEETEKRRYLQQDLWEKFTTLHMAAETMLQCVLKGTPVPVELVRLMGYTSPDATLCSSDVGSSQLPAVAESVLASSLWVDPLHSDYYSDDEMLRESGGGSKEEDRHRVARGGGVATHCIRGSGHSWSCGSLSLRSTQGSDGLPDGDTCRGGSTAALPLQSTLRRLERDAAAVTGVSTGTGAIETQAVAPPSPPPLCPTSSMESPGEVTPPPRTSESHTASIPRPSCAANVPVKKLAMKKSAEPVAQAKEGLPRSGFSAASTPPPASAREECSPGVGSIAAVASTHVSPHRVSLTDAPAEKLSEDCKVCPPSPRQRDNCGGVDATALPARLEPTVQENPEPAKEGDDAVLNSNKTLVKKKSKGRLKPRWMLATEAYTRRANPLPTYSLNATTQSFSSHHEANRAYSKLSAEQLFEEERAFMDYFAKTKRVF